MMLEKGRAKVRDIKVGIRFREILITTGDFMLPIFVQCFVLAGQELGG